MSLNGKIDHNRPYTQEEKDWLLTRAGGRAQVDVNERQFSDLSDSERSAFQAQAQSDSDEEAARRAQLMELENDDDNFDPEDVAKVAPLSTAELRAWLAKKEMDQDGNKEDLQVRVLEKMEADRLGTPIPE